MSDDGEPKPDAAPNRIRRVNGESHRPRRRAAPASPPADLEAKLGTIRRVLDAHKSHGGEDRRRGEPRGAEALDAQGQGAPGQGAQTRSGETRAGATRGPGQPREALGRVATTTSASAPSSSAFDASASTDSSHAPRTSYRGPLLAALIVLVVLAVAALVFAATGLGAQSPLNAPAATVDASTPAAPQAPASGVSAANWVIGAVGSGHVVACDVSVCGYLRAQGFPAQSLITVQAGVSDVEQADVLVSTSLLRSQFGAKLNSVLSPEPLAVFGGGPDATRVYAVALNGPSAYGAALRADRTTRTSVGGQLSGNKRLSFSPAARAQLATGQVDTRVCALLALLAGTHSISVSGFLVVGPGAGPDIPAPGVVIASVDGKPANAGSAAAAGLIKAARAQQAPYVPMSASTSGAGVEILFAQPGTLGLLTGSTS